MLSIAIATARNRSTRCRTILQRPLSTYYDSQSGIHVTRSNSISLHDITTGITNLDLSTASTATLQYQHATNLLDLETSAAADTVDGVSIDIVLSTFTANRTSVVELIGAAKSHQLSVRANLLSAFEATPNHVQLVAGILADAQADIICLCDTTGTLSSDEEDAADTLQEFFEAVTWLDVVGLPIVDRLALRLNANSNVDVVKMVALGGDWREMPMIRHWDTDEVGKVGMETALVRDILLEHGDRPDACRGGGASG